MDSPQPCKPLKVVAAYPVGPKGVLCDVAAAFILLTRIPLPWSKLTSLAPDMNRGLWAYPLVGFCVSAIGAVVLYGAHLLSLPSLLGAALALVAMIFTTGAFHEDGLADVADGFGGGFGRDRKLEIMRDSRTGAYGTIAVVMSLALRLLALGHMSLVPGIAALLVSGAVSRFWILAMLKMLPPARQEGVGTAAGVPSARQMLTAGAICLVVLILLLPLSYVLPVVTVAALSFLGVAFISHRQVGGYTGDVLGAVQQVSEIAILIGLLSLSSGAA